MHNARASFSASRESSSSCPVPGGHTDYRGVCSEECLTESGVCWGGDEQICHRVRAANAAHRDTMQVVLWVNHAHTHTHGTTPEKKPVCGVSLGPGASVHGAAQQQTVPRNGAVQQARHSQAAFLGRGEKKGRPPPVVALFGNPRRHVTKPALHVPLPVWGRGQEKETRMQKL